LAGLLAVHKAVGMGAAGKLYSRGIKAWDCDHAKKIT